MQTLFENVRVLEFDAWAEYAHSANEEDLARDWEDSFGDPAYYGFEPAAHSLEEHVTTR